MSDFEVLASPIKSEGDKKEYRLIKLSNGLKALLMQKVEDSAESEPLAAAALSVSIGSYDEPQSIGGLAHFLEHMLDLGSEKYPDESSFNQFVSLNGGWYNAYTQNVCTTYFFEISEKAFRDAIDRFAQQFVSPLFVKSMLQREREAVDSEYQMAKANDCIRTAAFGKILMREDHPASWFNYGNLRTLKDETTDDDLYIAVCELFKKYIPNIMHLSMQSNKSLDEMQQLVIDNFSGLKSGEVSARSKSSLEEIFKPDFYTKMHFVKPLEVTQELYLAWYIEPVDQHYKCKPLNYLAKVFNNEGEGGLSNFLKQHKLALSTCVSECCDLIAEQSMFNFVKIHVNLTDHGLANIDKVLNAIFSYVLMIRETPMDEHRRLYNEFKEISQSDFKFRSELSAWANTLYNTMGMQYFDDENILSGHSLLQEFDEKVINDIIDAINQRKFNLMIVNGKHETFDKKENYFGIEYEEKDFPEEYQNLWDERKSNSEFFLEKPNPFKCTNFDIFINEEKSPKFPVKVFDNDKFEVWHKLDSKFKLPQGYVYINILSPLCMNSAVKRLTMLLFEKIFTFGLTKKLAAANNAGLSAYSDIWETGFCLDFCGYNEKLLMVVEDAIKLIIETAENVDEVVFDTQKKDLKKTLKNSVLNPSCLQTNVASHLLRTQFWSALDYHSEIDDITIETLLKLTKKFFSNAKVQILVQGNMQKSQSLEIVKILDENLAIESLKASYKPKVRGYQLPLGTSVLRIKSFMLNGDNSSIKNFYQAGPYSTRSVCLLQLLESILQPKAFDFLRTKQQLGYDCGVSTEEWGNVLGFSVFVLSQESKNNFASVLEKMEFFINDVASKLIAELSDEELAVSVEARVKMLTTDSLDVYDEREKNWNEIKKQEYNFNRSETLATETKALSKLNIQEFFKSTTESGNMRRLSFQIVGENKSDELFSDQDTENEFSFKFMTEKLDESECLIDNVAEFQNKLLLYPVISESN